MEINEIKKMLANPTDVREDHFRILSAVSAVVNNAATISEGRELVIRTLAIKEKLSKEFIPLLNDLVRSVGLVPYTNFDSDIELADQIVIEAHRAPGFGDNTFFHTLQLQIYKMILAGRNVLLSATTSVGKSLVVDAVIATKKFRKIVIIVPTIALIDETRRRISRKFGHAYSIITHPTQLSIPGIDTVYILTQERALTRDDLADTNFFVIDEFYKLDLRAGNEERAVDLNLCFHRLSQAGAQFYLIGPHISSIQGLEGLSYTFLPSQFSTVALDIQEFGFNKNDPQRNEKLIELLETFVTPTLVYCQSPVKAAEVTEYIIEHMQLEEVDSTSDAVRWLEREYPSEWIVTKALRYGIGIHHGNVPRAIQQYMVKAFESNLVKFLICTSTLIEGVNTVAENIILYDRRIKTSNLDYFTYRNISGRAGRMGRYFIGKVFVLEEPPPKEEFGIELPISSQDEKTPLSLLLDLHDTDLSSKSKSRIERLIQDDILNINTIRANRQIPVEIQYAVAKEVEKRLLNPNLFSREDLGWRGIPSMTQLTAVCEIIFEHLENRQMGRSYRIFSGSQLATSLNNLKRASSLREFIDDRVDHRHDDDSVSHSVETTLRFIRKYLGFTFPRQLMAVNHIYQDVATRLGILEKCDYSLYAASVEHMFLEAGLHALDEYGLPAETARRISLKVTGLDTLSKALKYIAGINVDKVAIDGFEKLILLDLQVIAQQNRFVSDADDNSQPSSV